MHNWDFFSSLKEKFEEALMNLTRAKLTHKKHSLNFV